MCVCVCVCARTCVCVRARVCVCEYACVYDMAAQSRWSHSESFQTFHILHTQHTYTYYMPHTHTYIHTTHIYLTYWHVTNLASAYTTPYHTFAIYIHTYHYIHTTTNIPLCTRHIYTHMHISHMLTSHKPDIFSIDKIIGLFCKRALLKRQYSAKETYNFIDPTDRQHMDAHAYDVDSGSFETFKILHSYHTRTYIPQTYILHAYIHPTHIHISHMLTCHRPDTLSIFIWGGYG